MRNPNMTLHSKQETLSTDEHSRIKEHTCTSLQSLCCAQRACMQHFHASVLLRPHLQHAAQQVNRCSKTYIYYAAQQSGCIIEQHPHTPAARTPWKRIRATSPAAAFHILTVRLRTSRFCICRCIRSSNLASACGPAARARACSNSANVGSRQQNEQPAFRQPISRDVHVAAASMRGIELLRKSVLTQQRTYSSISSA